MLRGASRRTPHHARFGAAEQPLLNRGAHPAAHTTTRFCARAPVLRHRGSGRDTLHTVPALQGRDTLHGVPALPSPPPRQPAPPRAFPPRGGHRRGTPGRPADGQDTRQRSCASDCSRQPPRGSRSCDFYGFSKLLEASRSFSKLLEFRISNTPECLQSAGPPTRPAAPHPPPPPRHVCSADSVCRRLAGPIQLVVSMVSRTSWTHPASRFYGVAD